MYFKIVAIDLDGTIAMHDTVHPSTWKILREVKKSGRSIILVTGRRLDAIEQLGPFEDLCEAIVAEDGAAVYFPSNQSVILPFGHLNAHLIRQLQESNIPLERGMAIVATTLPYNQQVVDAIAKSGSAATIEYNKGAVMVLPPGATKGTGLMVALHELGYSAHNVIAFGDAENDRSLFEQAEIALAVQNADPEMKELADAVLDKIDGEGVRSALSDLLASRKLPSLKSRAKRQISLGKTRDNKPFFLDPLTLTRKNVGIFGASGSGKSWLGGLIAEKLFRLEYQICVIDPEGDYRSLKAFPNTLLLGGSDSPPPHGSEVSTLLEYSNMSLVLDLSMYSHNEKLEYISDLMITLLNLRERRGIPHWFLIDEAHYFCHRGQKNLVADWSERMTEGGFALLSYRPAEIDGRILEKLDHLMITQVDDEVQAGEIIANVCKNAFDKTLFEQLQGLTDRQVYYFIKEDVGNCQLHQGIMEIEGTRRKVPHIRHLNKYLRAPLPAEKQFYFQQKNSEKLPNASSLYDFVRILPRVPVETLTYHLNRGDFESWVLTTLHDEELAHRIHKIANRHLEGQVLSKALTDAVSSRYEELEVLV